MVFPFYFIAVQSYSTESRFHPLVAQPDKRKIYPLRRKLTDYSTVHIFAQGRASGRR